MAQEMEESKPSGTRPPIPTILVPEPDPSGEPSKRPGRRLFAVTILVVVGFAALWVGVTQWLAAKNEADEMPALVAEDSAMAAAPAAVTDSASALATAPTEAAPAPTPPPAPAPAPKPPPVPAPAPVRARPAPAARRLPAPRVVTPRPAPTKPKPKLVAPAPPPSPLPAAESARLLIRSVPGGTLYIDDRLIGPANEMAVPVAPGRHVVRVTKPGYRAYSRQVDVVAYEEKRLTDVVLEPEQ
jgi:hypothetical protein